MQKTILQVPLDKQLKNNAEKVASEQGFSSLQEVIRVFLRQLATKKIQIAFQEPTMLSSNNENRYIQMTKDFKLGENIYSVDNVDDLLSRLNAD